MDLGAGITNGRGNHLSAPPSPALDDSDGEWETPTRAASPAFNILEDWRNQLAKELAIAEGAENILQVFAYEPQDGNEELKQQVESELEAARAKITELEGRIYTLEQQDVSSSPILRRTVPNSPRSTPGSPTPVDIFPAVDPAEVDDAAFARAFETVAGLLQSLVVDVEPRQRIRAMDSVVKAVSGQIRIKYEIKLEESLPNIMACLSEDAGKDVRAAIYRLLRYLIVDQHDVNELRVRYIELFLIRSLSRDHKFENEKEQALRLIRCLLSLPDAERPVDVATIRAVVAIAENQDEKLRLACLETLGELVVRDTALLFEAEGLRTVLQALSDGPHDLAPYLATGFLWVMDRPESRRFLRPGVDLEIVLASFTDVSAKSATQDEKIRASAKIVATFAKSWSGIMYLNMNARQAVKSLVEALKSRSQIIRETLLDVLFDIFKIKTPSWFKSTITGYQSSAPPISSSSSTATTDKPNLINHFHAMLLLIFIDAGLLEALVAVAEDPRDLISVRKVALLIGEILQLSNRVLPVSYATRVQALPRLFSLAAAFDSPDGRLAASSTLSAVDSLNRNRSRLHAEPTEDSRTRSNSLDDPFKRGQRQLESSRIQLGMQIDDTSFRNLLLETQVLNTKDHTKWSFEILIELLEGPLLNPRRLDEAMRASKFMRRLLSFFHPFNYRFSDVRKTPYSMKFVRLACAMITTLLANPDGVRYLLEDKLLRQIAECLIQLDPSSRTPASEVLLTRYRMEETLSSGYFDMLGVLTKSPDGIRLLEQAKIFTAFYRISELKSREDLLEAIIENVDYTSDGHSRVFLSKALTSNHHHVRLFATQYLAKLTRESPVAEEWQIRLILTQLYDAVPKVCECAVQVLEKICESTETLESVVAMRPSLDHLGDMGAVLFTRFLSTSIGLRYLQEIDFIDQELESWFLERNHLYVVQLELLLASALGTDGLSNEIQDSMSFDGTPPPHFYGELVKTDEGCQILEASGHFAEFSTFIRQHGLEDSDSDVIARLKSVLWAIGQVGSSENGLRFLEAEYIAQSIVEIAEDSPVYSLRGTAYFVLGLIASTVEGIEILDELGWESVTSPLERSPGICVPQQISQFLDTPIWDTPTFSTPESLQLGSPTSNLEKEALAAFANLSNHILATKASKSLARLKIRHRELFSSPSLYYRALDMLENYHYRLPVRRYIIELFDVKLDQEFARSIMLAGEEMRSAFEDVEMGNGNRRGAELTRDVEGLSEVEGSGTDDDEDEESIDGAEVSIPLRILEPLLVVKGFVL